MQERETSTEETIPTPIPTATLVQVEIAAVLNRHSQENASNTPDWILAQYLMACLAAWNTGTQLRDRWYGREPRPFSVDSES